MYITLTPIIMDASLVVVRSGDVLTINDEGYDFSGLPDGATTPAGTVPCQWIAGPVERIDGVLHLTLLLPHGYYPPSTVAHPDPIIDPPDGPLDLPFADWRELVSAIHNGEGIMETYVIHRWRQPDEMVEVFVPDPPPQEAEGPADTEEVGDVDT